MIVVLKPHTTQKEIEHICDKITEAGLKPFVTRGEERTIIGVIGDDRKITGLPLAAFPGVEQVVPILSPWKLVSRDFKKHDSVMDIGGVKIGGKKIQVMAGPCAVEKKDLLFEIAYDVKAAGATILRGGAYKPRSSPHSFQGLGREGLEYLAEAKKRTGLLTVTELVDTRDAELVMEYADIIQIGARNMQNFELLKEVGSHEKPVLLKRGLSATITEFLLAAEYIMTRGNHRVILCERGIRTFETMTRNTLDLSAVPVIKQVSHLPVFVDPSHATGKWALVAPMARAAIAAGADGLMIEVHPNPEEALCDGEESLTPKSFKQLMKSLQKVAEAVGREI